MTIAYGPLLDALRGVRWPAHRAVGAALPGLHRSRQRGTAGEFTEYRLYRQGDDPCQLDWKLLARSDRAFVRLTDDRALLTTWFVLDASASMDFPRRDSRLPLDSRAAQPTASRVSPDKWSTARALAVGLAAVAHASGDPVGAIVPTTGTASGGVTRFMPRTRRGTITELSRMLDAIVPGGDAALTPPLSALSPNTRIVIITDLLGDVDALLRTAAQLVAAGGMVECVHVVAAEEIDPPVGVALATDPEMRDMQRVFDRNALPAYREAFAAFRSDMSSRWRATGARYAEARTDAALPRVVRQIVAGAGR